MPLGCATSVGRFKSLSETVLCRPSLGKSAERPLTVLPSLNVMLVGLCKSISLAVVFVEREVANEFELVWFLFMTSVFEERFSSEKETEGFF